MFLPYSQINNDTLQGDNSNMPGSLSANLGNYLAGHAMLGTHPGWIGGGGGTIKDAAPLFGMPSGAQPAGPSGPGGGGGGAIGGGGTKGGFAGAIPEEFIPRNLSNPFTQGISAVNNAASFAGQALPGAALFQAGLYDPTMNAMESSFMGSAANLGRTQLLQAFANAGNTLGGAFNQGHNMLNTGLAQGTQMLDHATNQGRLGLQDAFNRIDSQYVNNPFHTTRAKQMDDAANIFAENQMNTGMQLGINQTSAALQSALNQQMLGDQLANNMAGMGMQFGNNIVNQGANLALERLRMATQNLPSIFGFPIQAASQNQQATAGLYNLGQNAMYGDTPFAMAVHSQIPQIAPTIVQGGRGGGK